MAKQLPLSMDLLASFMRARGLAVNTGSGQLNILGLRGAVPAGDALLSLVDNLADFYNDTLVVFGKLPNGQTVIECFLGTVDPGAKYTSKPLNKSGCAHLLNGQYRYTWGLHKGHKALVQYAPVKIWRDMNRNFVRDPSELEETGYFGINIHAGGATKQIGSWSAGCTNVQGGWQGKQWLAFIALIQRHVDKFIYYTVDDAAAVLAHSREVAPEPLPDGELAEMVAVMTEAQRILYMTVRKVGLPDAAVKLAVAGLNQFNNTLVEYGLKQ